MASYFLPSFLSGWDLSAVSAFSLSATLQKRILSYLLKRTLGHLVQGGQLDIAQIDAGIGSGRVQVNNVQLDADAINHRLPSLPFIFVSGQIGSILIQLPVPNFWSGQLSITISDISVHVAPSHKDASSTFDPAQDLAASFASAASEIFIQDDEAKDLEQSIHQSLSPQDLQERQQQSEDDKASLIAKYVEALLTRLKVAIDNVQLHLHSDSIDLSIQLSKANIHSTNTRTEQQVQHSDAEASQTGVTPKTSNPQRRFFSETVRTLEFQGLELWLQDKRKQSEPDDSYSSSSSDYSFEGETSVRQERVQNMAQSTASLQESSASLYESAIGGSAFEEALQLPLDTAHNHLDKSPDNVLSASAKHLLFSLGQEPVLLTLKTIKERHELPASGSASRRTVQRLVGFSTSVDLQIGNAGAVLFIDHASLLMKLARMFSDNKVAAKPSSSANQAKSSQSPIVLGSSVERKLELSCNVSSFNLIIAYDDSVLDERVQSSLDAFWARPSRSHPDVGHVRLRCDKLSAMFHDEASRSKTNPSQPKVKLTMHDLGLFEHLPAALCEHCLLEASRTLPIFVLDHNLVHSRISNTQAAKHHRHDYASSTIDVFDWRYAVPHSATDQHSSGFTDDPPGSARAPRFKTTDARAASSSSSPSPYYRAAYGDRGWKLKSSTRHSTSSQGSGPEENSAGIVVSVYTPSRQKDQGRISASVAPIHFFIDVSLVTRLMPALRRFAAAQLAALRESECSGHEQSESTATLATSFATIHGSACALRDDLGTTPAFYQKSAYCFDISISLVRLDIRTPQVSYDVAALVGRDLNSARKSGLERRSGMLVLQVQALIVRSGLSETPTSSSGARFEHFSADGMQRSNNDSVITAQVSVESISAYLALPSESRALILALIEAVYEDQSRPGPFSSSPAHLLPRIQFSSCAQVSQERHDEPSRSNTPSKDRCSIFIPSIKAELGKSQLDSLQYMADDLTQSANLWTSDDLDESGTLDAEDLQILGSRFFGSRAGMSMMSASTDSTATARAIAKNSSLSVAITEASIRLWLPDLCKDGGSPRDDVSALSKSLLLVLSDFELLFDSDKAKNTTRIELRVPQIQLSVEARSSANNTSSFLLAFRTLERSLDDRSRNGMLLLVLEAYAEAGTSYREQNVDLMLCSVTLSPSFDDELIPRVKRLFKAPAGVFENVEPNEVTRISFKAKDCSIYVAPPSTSNRGVMAIGEASVKTKLTSHAPKTAVKLAFGNLDLFAIEAEAQGVSDKCPSIKSASEYWASRGFARLVHVPESKGSINLNTLTRPEVDVKITKLRVKLQATADSLDVVTGLVGAISSAQPQTSKTAGPNSTTLASDNSRASAKHQNGHDTHGSETSTRPLSATDGHLDRMAALMSGIEENAYQLALPLPVGTDLVDDDVPSDAAFLGAKGRYHPEIVETTLDSEEFFGGESVASLSLLAPRTDTVIFADEDVTVRLVDPKGICPVPNYFTDPDMRPHVESAFGPAASSVRVKVSNFDLSLRLHSGYDWASTRKAVQREAKLVRKRLQKIKQLLSEGQTPDDSVEAATSHLLDSVHISLPGIPAEMDPEDMMQAVADELGEHSDAASNADSDASASWQTLPTARRNSLLSRHVHSTSSTMSEARHTKLQRSARSMIDFNFRGLEVEFEKADPSQPSHVVSRLAVNVRRFEIIDNIKTSTWRTFLTEMQDRHASLRQDLESRMIKVEILNVRPEEGALDDASVAEVPEVRMRAKISPLRLHVDQDALDFLKKFFMFKPPGQKAPSPAPESTGPVLPFVQFAEVLPIKIKLDYKPKRVDYNLLRQGRTIELMNFFHFEGSEMVLRHITLRGINGWARLFDTLNDIWTPDVKANQLADFLSGLGPVRSLVNVGAGLADLVLLPIEQYHKDGRVLRGMQKGATSFAKSTALEAVKLGARLATGTQVILEQAERILGGEMPAAVTARAVGPDNSADSYASLSESIMVSSRSSEIRASWTQGRDDSLVSRYAQQPENMRDALSQAYSGLTDGLTSAAQTILAIPMEVYEPGVGSGDGSGGGAVGAGRPVVKAVPIAVLRGARGATQAIAKAMQGVQVSLGDLENVREGKYKQPSNNSGPRR
ncbi:related to APG2 - required for sporulation [Melanopsichium pennsylvanicum]|uniref:Autophagy-related protein 2 n=2 Tax=Melanopsichium pennsylvanicum TaxID=63383 RepID=A0AAJ4XHC0_9BASI|nr:related to APG2-required for sporulation [Melanopsichium pennsylvanicum 4]SNX82554.1 related to APG2 - required for sporulation [Melanopsichium pennsylvanicum]